MKNIWHKVLTFIGIEGEIIADPEANEITLTESALKIMGRWECIDMHASVMCDKHSGRPVIMLQMKIMRMTKADHKDPYRIRVIGEGRIGFTPTEYTVINIIADTIGEDVQYVPFKTRTLHVRKKNLPTGRTAYLLSE